MSADLIWYKDGLAFQCSQCGHCCSGPSSGFVWVDDEEIAQLAAAMEQDDIDAFERRFVRQVGIERVWWNTRTATAFFSTPDPHVRCL